MQLDGGAAVFELIGFLDGGEGQLAFLAYGHEADVEFVGDHGTQNETARIQARNHIGAQRRVHVAMHERVDQHAEDFRVLQQRRDVAELHARRGPVGHRADVLPEVIVDGGVEHGGNILYKAGRGPAAAGVYTDRAPRCRGRPVVTSGIGSRP